MRLILYLGKGGVGKTTTAAATAVRASQLGYRTLVVSTDVAHSLADVLDQEVGALPTKLATNLWAQEVNVLEEVRQHWGELQGFVSTLLKRKGVNEVAAEELAVIPGMEEVVSLLHIRKQAKEGNYDAVIVDAAPTGETVRLLTMPETFTWYASRVMQWETSTMKIAKPLVRALVPASDVFDSLPRFVEQVDALRATLIDPKISSYRLVVNPERMVIKEAQRAATYLALYGYPVDGVVLNRVLPASATGGDFLAQMQAMQATYRDQVYDIFAPLPIWEAPMYAREIKGLEDLGDVGHALFGERSPLDVFFEGKTMDINKIGDQYELRLPLPHVEVNKVNMTKRGDQLFIEIGNFRREMILPSLLANRPALKAMFRSGELVVQFGAATPLEVSG